MTAPTSERTNTTCTHLGAPFKVERDHTRAKRMTLLARRRRTLLAGEVRCVSEEDADLALAGVNQPSTLTPPPPKFIKIKAFSPSLSLRCSRVFQEAHFQASHHRRLTD